MLQSCWFLHSPLSSFLCPPLTSREYLTEQSVPTSKVTIFANNYNSNQDSLKYSLASTGFYFPHIVDVSWRADFNTKSNENQDQIKSDAIPKIYIKYES
jgi:hypothetical protein